MAGVFAGISIDELKNTREYKDVEAIKVTDKRDLTEDETRYVMRTAVSMKVVMAMLDELGFLHHPLIEQSRIYITTESSRQEFVDEMIKSISQVQKRKLGYNRKRNVVDGLTKLISFATATGRKKRKNSNLSTVKKLLKRKM